MKTLAFLAGLSTLPLLAILLWALMRREHVAPLPLALDDEQLAKARRADAIIRAGRFAGIGCYES